MSRNKTLAILIVPARQRLLLLSLLVTPVPKNDVSVCMCRERSSLCLQAAAAAAPPPQVASPPILVTPVQKNDVSVCVCAGGLSTEAY